MSDPKYVNCYAANGVCLFAVSVIGIGETAAHKLGDGICQEKEEVDFYDLGEEAEGAIVKY